MPSGRCVPGGRNPTGPFTGIQDARAKLTENSLSWRYLPCASQVSADLWASVGDALKGDCNETQQDVDYCSYGTNSSDLSLLSVVSAEAVPPTAKGESETVASWDGSTLVVDESKLPVLRDSKKVSVGGTRSADGGCDFQSPQLSLAPGEVSVVAREILIDNNQCTATWQVGVAREPECLPGHNGRPGHGLDRCDGHEPALGHGDGDSYEQRILQGMEDRCRQSDLELCSIQHCLELDRLLRDKRQRKRQLVLAVGQRLGTTEPQEFHLRRIGMRRTVCEHDRALPQQGLLLPRHGLRAL